MARCPSLEDYDRGSANVFWAETVARKVHASYDRWSPAEWIPDKRTPSELAADANVAQERYKLHRERVRALEAEARELHKRNAKEIAEHARKRHEEWKELQEAYKHHEAVRRAERDAAEARRQRWLREETDWRVEYLKKQLLERSVLLSQYAPKSAAALGTGNIVRIVNKNVAIGQDLRLMIGEVWDLGDYWFGTLISDGYAEAL